MLEENSIDGLNFEDLFKDLCIEIEVEEVPQIEGIGGLDDLCPEVAVDSILIMFCQGKEAKSMDLRSIGSDNGDTSGAGEDDEVIPFHVWKGEDFHGIGKGPKVLCPDDVCLF